jgi:hypothetical protein
VRIHTIEWIDGTIDIARVRQGIHYHCLILLHLQAYSLPHSTSKRTYHRTYKCPRYRTHEYSLYHTYQCTWHYSQANIQATALQHHESTSRASANLQLQHTRIYSHSIKCTDKFTYHHFSKAVFPYHDAKSHPEASHYFWVRIGTMIVKQTTELFKQVRSKLFQISTYQTHTKKTHAFMIYLQSSIEFWGASVHITSYPQQ